jgi:hypothetical protein
MPKPRGEKRDVRRSHSGNNHGKSGLNSMHWVAPSEKDTTNGTLEKRLWDSADQFRANSGLKAQEYPGPRNADTFSRALSRN